MSKRVLSYNPLNGVRTTFEYDHATDTTIVGYDDPFGFTDKVLDWNKRRKPNITKNDLQEKRDFIHYARIPPMAQLDMMARHGVKAWEPNHRRKLMSLLNTNEYQDCRIASKKHDR